MLVHFGSFSLTGFIFSSFSFILVNWVLAILVHVGSFWLIFVNWVHTIFENITIQKTRKYFTETKIPIVFKTLFKVIEKH